MRFFINDCSENRARNEEFFFDKRNFYIAAIDLETNYCVGQWSRCWTSIDKKINNLLKENENILLYKVNRDFHIYVGHAVPATILQLFEPVITEFIGGK